MKTNANNIAPRNKKSKGCIIAIIIFLLFCMGLIFGISQILKNPDKYNTKGIVKKHIDVTTEEGDKIDSILSDCGIPKVKDIKADESLNNVHSDGETGYRIIINDSVDNIIMYLNADKTVYSISYSDYDLYSDGSVMATIQDYTFTSREKSELNIKCEEKVKEILKSPSTAKFPNILKWGFGKKKNIVTVQGYVDSENGFGAEVRSDFQFIIDTDTNTIQSFIFDKQEMIAQ